MLCGDESCVFQGGGGVVCIEACVCALGGPIGSDISYGAMYPSYWHLAVVK